MSVAASPAPVAVTPASARAAEVAGWLALAALLLVALPLFLRMPLALDVTFYDLCGRSVLRGSSPEHDYMYLTTPGLPWALALVRVTLGAGDPAVLAADLLVVGTAVVLLCRYLGRMGLSRAGRVWAAVMLSGLYLSTSEWVHVQPDVWMLLPAVVALGLRRRAVEAAAAGAPRPAAWSVLEGTCWGAACLFKPFGVVPGLLTWLASVAVVWPAGPGARRRLAADAAGLLAGGLLVAALWQGGLLAHGAWHDYWHNVAAYGGSFYAGAPRWPARLRALAEKLQPWGALHALALLILGAALARAALRRGRRPAGARARSLALLGAFYLGWLVEGNFLQYQFHYHVVPSLLLALALAAGVVSWLPRPGWAWAALGAFVALAAAWQPAFRRDRLALWGDCWRGTTPELKDRLALFSGGPSWRDLARVADYLRAQHPGGTDVLCYGFSTTPLYLELGLRPPSRFLIPTIYQVVLRDHGAAILDEVRRGPQRYVVTELGEAGVEDQLNVEWPGDPPEPPPEVRARVAGRWPYGEPVAYRAGRYCVHRVSSGGTRAGSAR